MNVNYFLRTSWSSSHLWGIGRLHCIPRYAIVCIWRPFSWLKISLRTSDYFGLAYPYWLTMLDWKFLQPDYFGLACLLTGYFGLKYPCWLNMGLKYSYWLNTVDLSIPTDCILWTEISLLNEYLELLKYPYWLDNVDWSIPTDWILWTEISLLTEYCGLKYPSLLTILDWGIYWLTILDWSIPTDWLF